MRDSPFLQALAHILVVFGILLMSGLVSSWIGRFLKKRSVWKIRNKMELP